MGAFAGLGPYNGHWFSKVECEKESEAVGSEGFYITSDYFYPHGFATTKGRWGVRGQWFDTLEESEAVFAMLERMKRRPVRWYKLPEGK